MTRSSVKAIPEGLHTITPHIAVRDAAQAAEWYKQAFGAHERSRVPLPGGKLMSVELWFGDSAVMVADEFPEMDVVSPQTVGGTSTVLNLYTEEVDALWTRAVDAGAQVLHPLQDQFWGDRHGQLIDPFGHCWGLATHLRDVPPAEVARAAAAVFGGQTELADKVRVTVSTSRSSPSATILAGPFVLTGIGLALTIAGPLPVSRITWPNDDVMLARDPDAMPADSEATRPRQFALNWIRAAAPWTAFALLLAALIALSQHRSSTAASQLLTELLPAPTYSRRRDHVSIEPITATLTVSRDLRRRRIARRSASDPW